MAFRFLLVGFLSVGWVVSQDLKAPPRCTGPECAERVRVKERTPRRRVQRQAETRVDRFGRPKPRLRAERYRFSPPSPRHKVLERAEAFTPYAPSVRHSARAERQKPPSTAYAHKLRAESYRPPLISPRYQPRKPEKWFLPLPTPAHRHLAEKHHYQPSSPRHKPYPERWAYQAPQTKHRRASERFNLSFSPPRHRKAPQRELYALPKPSHRTTHQRPCEPPPISHPTEKWTAIQSYLPPLLRHSQKHQRSVCDAPAVSHPQAYQRARCAPPPIAHRSPKSYTVPCDAQRRGVMTQTERFAYDLRYLFTNHRKHCEVQSAYSGVSIGEWVNTESYGRVPVVAYKMGWRVYHFAHFHDKKGHRLKKPRIEKRKVWALYQIQVLVPQPAKGKSQKRRYIKGLPGIEGFGGVEGMVLEAKWLSPQETKAIQIEKLVRKRQIAWLVRAYPEEQVRLPEWLQKYAGPKPEHLWPGVDYRLLEVWQ